MTSRLEPYLYTWPHDNIHSNHGWKDSVHPGYREHPMPESAEKLEKDSRWPGFFPSPICFVTTTDGRVTALEKVVGATIVNRFPYIVALSFCTQPLSSRHYVRKRFMEILEAGQTVAIQFFPPGKGIDRVMQAIGEVDDAHIEDRIAHTELRTVMAQTNPSPVFEEAYMVYEASLVKPGKDFEGEAIYSEPYADYGSHRIYFLEIEAIQLRKDIAHGESQVHWKSLPDWEHLRPLQVPPPKMTNKLDHAKYQKGYTSNYYFPAKNTIAFAYDRIIGNMAIKFLPPLPEDQVEVDNDMARWPCFFPSSVGLITTWDAEGNPNLMPCGSTTVLIRHPLCIGICVSYARINIRYAPRASLKALNETKTFVCGVPFSNDTIISAIKYAGNISVSQDKDKITNAGLEFISDEGGPLLTALPVNFRCKVVKVVRLGTHFLFLGEVQSVIVREDVGLDNPIKWYSYADIEQHHEQ